MAKMRFWLSVGYKLIAGIVAGIALWLRFESLGLNAWRLLETWLLVVTLGYFLTAAITEWFQRKAPMPHRSFCPLIQGAIIVIGISLGILRITYEANHLEWLGVRDFLNYVELLALPLLAIGDWLFFTKKGQWSLSYPWYWLGIVISYGCLILLTADFIPSSQGEWKYPYFLLNYPEIGIDSMLWWMALVVVVMLVLGYCFMLLDFALSGQLGKHVVLPKIKTIVIEEEPVIEPEVIVAEEILQPKPETPKAQPVKPKAKPDTMAKTKTLSKPKKPSMDIVRPVEGLKDRKFAQKLHRPSKSKSDIIADMRLQVKGNKNSQSKPRKKS